MNWKNRKKVNELSIANNGDTVTLNGWVDTVRDHGQLLFTHLRDVSGNIQLVFDPERDLSSHELAKQLRSEFVVSITGTLQERDNEAKNPNMASGEIEIYVTNLTILTKAKTPPFMISEKESQDSAESHHVDEDLRLKYRFLDIRRPSIQKNLIKRHHIMKTIRDHFHNHEFYEIETPILTKSTPEGARDYLVPSRPHAEKFYALPQSPQLFKQLLMMGGMDRYVQITKCFRDEDLRPNRQPEFTQVDFEASFIDETFIYELINPLIETLFKTYNSPLSEPIRSMTYKEAIETYGSDKPDLRYDLRFVDVTHVFKNTNYKIFNSIIASGGIIKGFNLKGQSPHLSKNVLQNELAKSVIQKLGGKGLSWMRVENDELTSNIIQFFSDDEKKEIKKLLNGTNDDVLVFVADTNPSVVHDVLGRFRVYIADRLNLVDTSKNIGTWITDFPLFEQTKDGQITSLHHPFTNPKQDITQLETIDDILSVTADAYDLAINGEEIGGGSIRIHDPIIQHKIFELLGMSDDEIKLKFGFFVNALNYGTPPHGGMAIGLDRLVAMLCNTDSIREVIAFPKNRMAICPMTDAPSIVDSSQLDELHLKTIAKTPVIN